MQNVANDITPCADSFALSLPLKKKKGNSLMHVNVTVSLPNENKNITDETLVDVLRTQAMCWNNSATS